MIAISFFLYVFWFHCSDVAFYFDFSVMNMFSLWFCIHLYVSISRETQDAKGREALIWILSRYTYVAKVNTWILGESRFLHLRNQPDKEVEHGSLARLKHFAIKKISALIACLHFNFYINYIYTLNSVLECK